MLQALNLGEIHIKVAPDATNFAFTQGAGAGHDAAADANLQVCSCYNLTQ